MERIQGSYPFLLALLLSGHGLRKKSLSPSGALAAFAVGFLMMSGGVRVFGLALIGFYLAGSRATKCKYSCKIFLNMHPENDYLLQTERKERLKLKMDTRRRATAPAGRSCAIAHLVLWQPSCGTRRSYQQAFTLKLQTLLA